MNRIFISGRLGGTPELKMMQNNRTYTSFSVAVYNGKDRDPIWVPVVAFQKVAEFICQYFSKGDPIEVIGRLKVNNFTRTDGSVVRSLEVSAVDVGFPPSSIRQDGAGATITSNGNNYTTQAETAGMGQKRGVYGSTTPSEAYSNFGDAGDEGLPF